MNLIITLAKQPIPGEINNVSYMDDLHLLAFKLKSD